jgi:hypothetical protein
MLDMIYFEGFHSICCHSCMDIIRQHLEQLIIASNLRFFNGAACSWRAKDLAGFMQEELGRFSAGPELRNILRRRATQLEKFHFSSAAVLPFPSSLAWFSDRGQIP